MTAALSLAALLSPLAMAHEGHKHDEAKEKASASVTLTGEVLDMSCFMAHEGKGSDHKKCASKCVLGGTPMGLLTADGTVYLLLEMHGKDKPYKAAQQLAGMSAKVTGTKAARGGITAILLETVEKVK